MKNKTKSNPYWKAVWRQFCRRWLGIFALSVLLAFALVGLYAPFLASSKPLFVIYDGKWYFPLFRYLFYPGFYTKRLDIFFNLLMFTLPLLLLGISYLKRIRGAVLCLFLAVQLGGFFHFAFGTPQSPASDPQLNAERQQAIQASLTTEGIHLLMPSWKFHLKYLNDYAKLNLVLRYQQEEEHHERLLQYQEKYAAEKKRKWLQEAIRDKKTKLIRDGVKWEDLPSDDQLEKAVLQETPPHIIQRATSIPTLWQIHHNNQVEQVIRLKHFLDDNREEYLRYKERFALAEQEGKAQRKDLERMKDVILGYESAQAKLAFLLEREKWLETESTKISFEVMPLLRAFHWEDDAGGDQNFNRHIPWWEITRINRKDLVAGLLFGIRISLVVGALAVALSLAIGIPIGALAGFYGGKFDIIMSRLLEIWESMPTFFTLLLVVAITQSKSIFLVISVVGIFGWTGFSRFIRGEFLKQRNLSYVEACRALGFRDGYIIFSHILPNAIPPLLTLLPFAIMGAMTSEAGLSFLGLGEEGSCSWGVLMDEARTAFPGESYLLWPPALLLTTLLVAIALVGDVLRDAIDPKMHR